MVALLEYYVLASSKSRHPFPTFCEEMIVECTEP